MKGCLKAKGFVLFAIACGLASCGREPVEVFDSVDRVAASCDLEFPKAGLCAEVKWTKPPTADEPNGFTVRFWEKAKGSPTGPFVEPASAPSSFLIMTCCKTPTRCPLKKSRAGEYEASGITLASGKKYWQYVVVGSEKVKLAGEVSVK